MMTVHLRAGDVLYMPRGVVHEALTASEESLHLTVGVSVLSWKTLLEDVLRLASEQDAGFRRALPVGFITSDERMPLLRTGLQELLAKLSSVPVEEAVDRLARRYLEQVPPLPEGDLRQAADAQELSPGTRLRKRAGVLCRVRAGGETVRIEFPGGSVQGPAPLEPALRFVAGTEEFAIRELPGGLSERAKLVLSRRLIAEGMLRVVQEPQRLTMANFA
jgi:hypothetical protein